MSKLTEIRQDNGITLSRYDYTSLEINLMTMVFEQVNAGDYSTYKIDLTEFYKLTGFDKSHMNRIRQAMKNIRKKDFDFYDREEKIYTSATIITSFQIHERQDVLFFNIDPFMKPFLFNIVKNTTRYYRESIMSIPRKNSKRIYHLCSMFKSKGVYKTDISQLRTRLGIDQEKYINSASMFRKRVLEPAINDINQFSDLEVQYYFEKDGKEITGIHFQITDKHKSKEKLPIPETESVVKYKEILKTEFGVAPWFIENIFTDLELKDILKVVYDTRLKKPSNPGAYIGQVFRNLGVRNFKPDEQGHSNKTVGSDD